MSNIGIGFGKRGVGSMSFIEPIRIFAAAFTTRLRIRSERGATAVEYAVMVALIAAVIILAVIFLGRTASSTFSQTGTCVSNSGAC
jgi:pilus assembly protein Flp/PilA